MSLRFTKMAGCGNDFVLLEPGTRVEEGMRSALAAAICRPGTGVGADGLVIFHDEPPARAEYGVTIVMRSGLPAEMCGNAARCIARFAVERGLAANSHLFLTAAGPVRSTVEGSEVRIELPDPSPMTLDAIACADGGDWRLDVVDVGVPHAVLWRPDVEEAPVERLGRALRHAAAFAHGANVNFVERIGEHLRVRTFERGAEAETLACGTGAVASAISPAPRGLPGPRFEIRTTHGGMLAVTFDLAGIQASHVTLQGPTTLVFEGALSDEWLAEAGIAL